MHILTNKEIPQERMSALKPTVQPLFRRIMESIETGIEDGTYAPGDAIPSEPELCKTFGTTRMTVRRAIDTLVSEGKLFRMQGKGTFVSHFDLDKTYQKQGFTSNMRSLGVQPSSRVLFAGECEAASYVRSDLELSQDEKLFCLKRVRLANGEPIAIERVWLSLDRFPKLPEYDFSKESLYEVLRRDYGVVVSYSKQKINAVVVEGEDARLLFHLKKGVALRLRNVDYGKSIQPIAAADALYHGAKYTLDVVV